MPQRQFQLIAGVLGAAGVALGAFGAHALKEKLAAAGTISVWETAARYHLIHAVALLAISVNFLPDGDAQFLGRAGWFWFVGKVLFSGSLYVLALGGPQWLGPITPLGGASLIAGWVCVALAGWKARRAPQS